MKTSLEVRNPTNTFPRHVERNSNVFTDEFKSYKGLVGFIHELSTIKGNNTSMVMFIPIPLRASGLY